MPALLQARPQALPAHDQPMHSDLSVIRVYWIYLDLEGHGERAIAFLHEQNRRA
jgi:hypothetical protein